MSLAELALTCTSVTGIKTWYLIISISLLPDTLYSTTNKRVVLKSKNLFFSCLRLTISFFFCLKRSLHKNTTADLNTKHIACNSKPFLILPRKSDIFNHSTPP